MTKKQTQTDSSRRQYLKAIGATGIAAGIAGCAGGSKRKPTARGDSI
ncbi:twin-arginine translocation signal domain-containing protein [Halorubrum saccharovorum]|nr:twin-arginine translocation signal domain-containing protein [Halorubrum saccharovorum]